MILSFPNLPFDFSLLPADCYLVGGAVRDALLNRKREYLDLDFVLPMKAVETARQIANKYQAGFVVLDPVRHIARVVFKTGTLDFAQQEGDSLETDLKRRDFTINAIAYHFPSQTIIDPLQGLKDLEKQVIKMVSCDNLKDDPLRLLRAYRQSAQLNFKIESETKLTIKELSPLIKKVAAERVQTELNYLLKSSKETPWLIEAGKNGLLQPWLINATEDKLNQLTKIDYYAQVLMEKYPPLAQLNQQQPSWYGLAKLANLVSDDPKLAEDELMGLKYSRSDIRIVIKILKSLPIFQKQNLELNLREQYFLFLDSEKVFPILALFARSLGGAENTILGLLNRYFDSHDPVAHPIPLMTGNDLIQQLKIKPSPIIGQLLTEIAIAKIENKIETKEDGLNFAENYLKTNQIH
jgi:tRNA nucleotidyltransferase (CCA-adding enzyme)